MSVRSKPNREVEAPAEPERDDGELPEGWVKVRLKELAKVEWGNTSITKKSYVASGHTAYSASGPDGFLPTFEWQGEAVVLSAIGARCGKCFFAEGEWTAIKNTIVIQGNPSLIDHRLLFHYLNDEQKWEISGSGQPFITMGTANETLIPLPPLAEQRRIVGKLELLLGKVSSSQQRLSRSSGLLKRFRQSVLAAACSGKLTVDWREENDCAEPASDLIARLGSERRERYRELCVAAKNANQGKPREFDNIEPIVRTDLDTFDLPSDWSWVDLRFVMTVDEPFCYGVVQPGANEPNGKLLVRAGDLQSGTVNLSELRRIPADIDADYERSRLKGGELLVTVVGAGIGTVAIAPASCAGFNIARAVAKVPIRDVSAEYVFQWFNTSKALSWMVGDAREVARPTLNLEQLRTILVPLPPLSEQQEIVRRVEKLFAFADQIESRLRRAAQHVDRLTQSLLAKAFRGELVPTEYTLATKEGREYEPASVLLGRIEAERNKTVESVKSRTRRSSPSPTRRTRR